MEAQSGPAVDAAWRTWRRTWRLFLSILGERLLVSAEYRGPSAEQLACLHTGYVRVDRSRRVHGRRVGDAGAEQTAATTLPAFHSAALQARHERRIFCLHRGRRQEI